MGYTAHDRAIYPHAYLLLNHHDTEVAPAALHDIAGWLGRTGRTDAARSWYAKVIATGHHDHAPNAMVGLGNLEYQQGNLDEARRWYHEAIATGHHEMKARAERDLRELAGVRRKAAGQSTSAGTAGAPTPIQS